MFCKNCGRQQQGGEHFCAKCGTPYTIEESTSRPSMAPPPPIPTPVVAETLAPFPSGIYSAPHSSEERRCPNCGANFTNTTNCEYCGSLLVRFVDKGIDLSKTSYTNDSLTFPGLAAELKRNLRLQKENPCESVVTDLFAMIGRGRSCVSILRSRKCIWSDKQPIELNDSENGLVIVFDFNTYINDEEEYNRIMDDQSAKFKRLDCFSLFTGHTGSFTDKDGCQRYAREYAIDFGNDAEGAARLISEILQKVKGWTPDTNFDMYTEVGIDNLQAARDNWNIAHGFGETNSGCAGMIVVLVSLAVSILGLCM